MSGSRTHIDRTEESAPLRIAMRRFADFEGPLREQTAAYAASTGSLLPSLSTYDLHGLHAALFKQGGLAKGSCDLALFSTDWLGEAEAQGLLEDLTPHLLPVAEWPAAWPASLTTPVLTGKRCLAVPWHDGPEALLYRADLFEDAGNQAAYLAMYGERLEPPRTWDSFLQVCRFFTRPQERLWGTLVAAYPDGHNTLYDLTLQLWSRGGDWTRQQGGAGERKRSAVPRSIGGPAQGHGQRPVHAQSQRQVQLQTAAMADSLAFYRRLVTDPALCHPASPRLASTESGDVLLAGEVAMMVNWFGFAARAARPGSPLAGRLALAPIPSDTGSRSISLSAYWVLGIASGSRRKQQAAALLRFLMQPEQDLRLLPHGAVPVRLSSWRSAAVQQQYPVYAQLEELSRGARTLPRSPSLPALADLADLLTQQAITTTRPIRVILAEAQAIADSIRL